MTDTAEFSHDGGTFTTYSDKYTGTTDGAENVANPKIGNVNH